MNPWIVAGVLLEPLLAMVYPARCACCGRVGDGWLCAPCRAQVSAPSGIACERCDLPLRWGGECPDCRALEPCFVRACAAGSYAGPLKRALLALKFEGCWQVGDCLAGFLAQRVRGAFGEVLFDGVVGVPLDAAREALRGFNQANLLAWRTAVRLGVPYHPRLLARTRRGSVQSRSVGVQRLANVESAFSVSVPDGWHGKRILLIDDVMTTGATLNAAAGALAQAGAQVWGLVVARGAVGGGHGRL